MKISFLGVGSAFTTREYYQSNMIVTSPNGKRLLIDCGTDIRFSLLDAGLRIGAPDAGIDAVYVSHTHSDHIGGLEYLAFSSFFGEGSGKIKLHAEEKTLRRLWDESLKGGLGVIRGRSMRLEDYFDCRPVMPGGGFQWEETRFELVRMPHVMAGETSLYSYGLLIRRPGSGGAFISTDALFQPEILLPVSREVSLLFHDCETTPFKSGVHAHYSELLTLPGEVRSRMWLYHYDPAPDYAPVEDGFRGFVTKGQEFLLD